MGEGEVVAEAREGDRGRESGRGGRAADGSLVAGIDGTTTGVELVVETAAPPLRVRRAHVHDGRGAGGLMWCFGGQPRSRSAAMEAWVVGLKGEER